MPQVQKALIDMNGATNGINSLLLYSVHVPICFCIEHNHAQLM